jgi:hypothetical protein
MTLFEDCASAKKNEPTKATAKVSHEIIVESFRMFGPHSIFLVCYGAMNSLRVKDVHRPRNGCVNNLSIICNLQETFLIRRTPALLSAQFAEHLHQ